MIRAGDIEKRILTLDEELLKKARHGSTIISKSIGSLVKL